MERLYEVLDETVEEEKKKGNENIEAEIEDVVYNVFDEKLER